RHAVVGDRHFEAVVGNGPARLQRDPRLRLRRAGVAAPRDLDTVLDDEDVSALHHRLEAVVQHIEDDLAFFALPFHVPLNGSSRRGRQGPARGPSPPSVTIGDAVSPLWVGMILVAANPRRAALA